MFDKNLIKRTVLIILLAVIFVQQQNVFAADLQIRISNININWWENFSDPYIKNYIYYCAKEKDEICEEDVFKEKQKKKGIVTANLLNIATYLEEIKEGTKLRLSIGDGSLTVSIREKTVPLTEKQEILVDALTFGMPLEKLQKGNYEDAKRLLFLPSQIKTNPVK